MLHFISTSVGHFSRVTTLQKFDCIANQHTSTLYNVNSTCTGIASHCWLFCYSGLYVGLIQEVPFTNYIIIIQANGLLAGLLPANHTAEQSAQFRNLTSSRLPLKSWRCVQAQCSNLTRNKEKKTENEMHVKKFRMEMCEKTTYTYTTEDGGRFSSSRNFGPKVAHWAA